MVKGNVTVRSVAPVTSAVGLAGEVTQGITPLVDGQRVPYVVEKDTRYVIAAVEIKA